MPNTHIAWILLNWKLEVLSRPAWRETITVHTWCSKVEKLYTYREFEIYDEKQVLVAKASSRWVAFNVASQHVEKDVAQIVSHYGLEPKEVFPHFREKWEQPETTDFSKQYEVQKRDIDTNHHVNNIAYLKFAYEILPEACYAEEDFDQIEIMYKKSLLYGKSYMASYKRISEKEYMVTIQSTDEKSLHALIHLQKSDA